ncbi:MAG: TraB/GumN family protein, partial [Sphingomonadales bacterium]|nr:TraB/GumN family protein [Sphingomonadales bacterium]
EFQISLLSSMSTETQIAMLSQTLDDKDKLAKLMEDMTLFWTTGDIASLEKTFNSSFENYPYLRETLLTSRNQNWVGDIQNILDKPGNYLVTVGTAHLIGEQSLIELLGDADITVTRVQ